MVLAGRWCWQGEGVGSIRGLIGGRDKLAIGAWILAGLSGWQGKGSWEDKMQAEAVGRKECY